MLHLVSNLFGDNVHDWNSNGYSFLVHCTCLSKRCFEWERKEKKRTHLQTKPRKSHCGKFVEVDVFSQNSTSLTMKVKKHFWVNAKVPASDGYKSVTKCLRNENSAQLAVIAITVTENLLIWNLGINSREFPQFFEGIILAGSWSPRVFTQHARNFEQKSFFTVIASKKPHLVARHCCVFFELSKLTREARHWSPRDMFVFNWRTCGTETCEFSTYSKLFWWFTT